MCSREQNAVYNCNPRKIYNKFAVYVWSVEKLWFQLLELVCARAQQKLLSKNTRMFLVLSTSSRTKIKHSNLLRSQYIISIIQSLKIGELKIKAKKLF